MVRLVGGIYGGAAHAQVSVFVYVPACINQHSCTVCVLKASIMVVEL